MLLLMCMLQSLKYMLELLKKDQERREKEGLDLPDSDEQTEIINTTKSTMDKVRLELFA